MEQFHDMLRTILATGVRRPNRTGEDTLFVPGFAMKFDMADGFPAITTKQLFFKMAVGEFVGFSRGFTSAAQFREIGCKVWDANANETESWLKNPKRLGNDDLGRIYGSQWTDWRDWREANTEAEMQEMLTNGYEVRAHDAGRNVWVMRRGMNQMEIALKTIMTDPNSRRIMITGWRPDESDLQCIPVCHCDYQILCDTTTMKMHLCMFQRSFDTGLGFNVALAAIFLHVFAKLAGYEPGTMSHFVGDAHIYMSHIPQLEEMITREHFEQPELVLGDSIPTLTSVDQIPGVFQRIMPEDFSLKGYQHHPKLVMKMAA